MGNLAASCFYTSPSSNNWGLSDCKRKWDNKTILAGTSWFSFCRYFIYIFVTTFFDISSKSHLLATLHSSSFQCKRTVQEWKDDREGGKESKKGKNKKSSIHFQLQMPLTHSSEYCWPSIAVGSGRRTGTSPLGDRWWFLSWGPQNRPYLRWWCTGH